MRTSSAASAPALPSAGVILAIILAAAALPAAGIELSLEENRAERGNIGYVDMQKLFRAFPETVRAKENFEELVRQAEEQVNLRKAELLRLRNELSQMKIQREFLAKTPITVSPAPAPAPAPEPQKPPQKPAEKALDSGRGTDIPQGLPGFVTAPSTAAAKKEPLIVNIPGLSTGPIVVSPPEGERSLDRGVGLPAPIVSSAPATPTISVSTATRAPSVTVPAAVAISTAPNPALAELDKQIAAKARELTLKEGEFREYQNSAEKNLIDLESRKTEILLGKIHRAINEIARKEGVSVVVDKTHILFGHDAVDLTEKVLKHLKGT